MIAEAEEATPEWSLGDRLRKAREHAGLKQDELAAAVGCSRATVIDWEKDKRSPKVELVERWAEATRVSRDWLLRTGSRCTLLPGIDGQMELALGIDRPQLTVAGDRELVAVGG